MFAFSIRARILSGAVILSWVCLAVLSRLPQPKMIEQATTSAQFENLVSSWGPSCSAQVGFSLGFDYLFMAAYVTAIGLGCFAVATGANGWLRQIGIALAYAQIASGLIDATENATLIWSLINGYHETVMQIACLATASKFTIPTAGLVYIPVGGLIKRWRARV